MPSFVQSNLGAARCAVIMTTRRAIFVCKKVEHKRKSTLWMSMQGRNRAAAMGAAWTVAEHCGTVDGRRLMMSTIVSALPCCLLRLLCRLKWRRLHNSLRRWRLGGTGATPLAGSSFVAPISTLGLSVADKVDQKLHVCRTASKQRGAILSPDSSKSSCTVCT